MRVAVALTDMEADLSDELKIMAAVTTRPHSTQRYETCGDWNFAPSGTLNVDVSQMGDWRYEFLVGLHELVEAMLCKARGVDQELVTAFDVAYEAKRAEGDESEPGEDPAAPYHREHMFASRVEQLVADELGIEWDEYNAVVEAL